MNNSNLQFTYDLGAGDNMVTLTYVNVSDGLWHTAKATRYGTQAILQLDHGEGTHYGETQPMDSHRLQYMGDSDSDMAEMFGGAYVLYNPYNNDANVHFAMAESK